MAAAAECLPACSDEQAAICDVPCSASADCSALGASLVCESGRCRSGAAGSSGAGASNAGAGGTRTDDAGASGIAAGAASTSGAGAGGEESSAGGRAAAGGSSGATQGVTGGTGARDSGAGGAGGEGASAGGGAISGVVEREDFPRALAEAICPGMARCCTNRGWPVNANCIDQITTQYADDIASFAPYPGVSYDPALAAACIEAYRAAVEDCHEPAAEPGRTAECQGMFYGTVPTNGACSSGDECAAVPGAFAYCVDGACQGGQPFDPSQLAKDGEPCGETCDNILGTGYCGGVYNPDPNPPTAICLRSDGLFCSETSHVCRPIAAVGEPCENLGCTPYVSYCDGSCVAYADTGPCSSGDSGPYCSQSSYCNPTTQMCTPRTANGQACTNGDECASERCYDGECHEWTAVTESFCVGAQAP